MHTTTIDLQRMILVQLGATRAMALASDVPQLLRGVVPWLRPEDDVSFLSDLPSIGSPGLWTLGLKDDYANAWWESPGEGVLSIDSWSEEYLKDLRTFKANVRALSYLVLMYSLPPVHPRCQATNCVQSYR